MFLGDSTVLPVFANHKCLLIDHEELSSMCRHHEKPLENSYQQVMWLYLYHKMLPLAVRKMVYRRREWWQEAGGGCSWGSPQRDLNSLHCGCSDGGEKEIDSGHVTDQQKASRMDWTLGVKEREESEQLSSWEGGGAICQDWKSEERSRFGVRRWESAVFPGKLKL